MSYRTIVMYSRASLGTVQELQWLDLCSTYSQALSRIVLLFNPTNMKVHRDQK